MEGVYRLTSICQHLDPVYAYLLAHGCQPSSVLRREDEPPEVDFDCTLDLSQVLEAVSLPIESYPVITFHRDGQQGVRCLQCGVTLRWNFDPGTRKLCPELEPIVHWLIRNGYQPVRGKGPFDPICYFPQRVDYDDVRTKVAISPLLVDASTKYGTRDGLFCPQHNQTIRWYVEDGMPSICEDLAPVLNYLLSVGNEVDEVMDWAAKGWWLKSEVDLEDLRRTMSIPDFLCIREIRDPHGWIKTLRCPLHNHEIGWTLTMRKS